MTWPKFGDKVENTYASLTNPTRIGLFVRSYRRTGRLNPGLWWELTDGQGNFWSTDPENCRKPVPDDYVGPLSGAPVSDGREPSEPTPIWPERSES